jgi:CxxC motif-containing protein
VSIACDAEIKTVAGEACARDKQFAVSLLHHRDTEVRALRHVGNHLAGAVEARVERAVGQVPCKAKIKVSVRVDAIAREHDLAVKLNEGRVHAVVARAQRREDFATVAEGGVERAIG